MKQDLEELYRALFTEDEKLTMAHLSLLAEMLSSAVDRGRPWTARLLHSILNGHKGYEKYYNKDVAIAIEIIKSGILDRTEVVVFSHGLLSATELPPGTLILGNVVRCDCGILFVPKWGNQKYHSHDCRRRAYNRRRRERRREER